jgi:hypothetical protein
MIIEYQITGYIEIESNDKEQANALVRDMETTEILDKSTTYMLVMEG